MTVISLMPDVAFAPITEGVKLEVGGFKSAPVPLAIPVTFGGNKNLAINVGGWHAVVLQHLEYLTRVLDGRVDELGKKWVRIAIESEAESISWRAHLPWLDKPTIIKILAELKTDGLIESRTFVGQSKWYWLNLEAILSLKKPVARLAKKKASKLKNMTIVASSNYSHIEQDSDHVELLIATTGVANSDHVELLIATTGVANSNASNILSNTPNNQSNTQKDLAAQNAALAESDSLNHQSDLEIQPPPQDNSAESTYIQAEVTAPPISAAPPQANKPKRKKGTSAKKPSQATHAQPEIAHDVVWSMGEGCRLIVTVMENNEPVMENGQPKRIIPPSKYGQLAKYGAELRDLGVGLEEIQRMTAWFLANEQRPYLSADPTKYLSKLGEFREYEANKANETIQAVKSALKAIYGTSKAILNAEQDARLSQLAIDLIAAGRDEVWVLAFPEIYHSLDAYKDCSLPKPSRLIEPQFLILEKPKAAQPKPPHCSSNAMTEADLLDLIGEEGMKLL